VEVWNFDSPVGVGVSPNIGNVVPHVINYGWREYGMRVGLWRLADVLEVWFATGSEIIDAYQRANPSG
jgi:allantoinase